MPQTLSDAEFLQLAGQQGETNAAQAPPAPILPGATAMFGATTGLSNVNAPPPLDQREIELARLGKREGVPFHQGLPTVADIELKSLPNATVQMEYLAKQYGAENIRMNELGEPVVRYQGEDYVVDPHKLTLNSLTGLMAYAPETLLSALAIKAGGPNAGIMKQALYGALGAAVGRTGKEASLEASAQLPVNMEDIAGRSVGQIPMDTAGGVLMGGSVKAGQIGYDLLQGKGLPNPLATMKFFKPLLSPANKELTSEGVAAAQRLAAKTGIPANLSAAEATGIPLLAQLETRQENVAAGASPAIAARRARDEVSRQWQNWIVQPATLPTDEEVARRGLGVLKSQVAPFENDVTWAKGMMQLQREGDEALLGQMRAQGEAAQQAKIIHDFNVGGLPTSEVPLTETGDLLRSRVIAMRDAEREVWNKRYEQFFDNPEVMDPTVRGVGLKNEIDATLKDLPGVTKLVEKPTGVLDAREKPIMRQELEKVPVATPIRPRLEELSSKLANGKVSINDLKQIRTDVGDAIKTGEAIPGVKEGRLKQLYGQLTDAINEGLDEIGDPALKSEWQALTEGYQKFTQKFSERTLAPLFKEADQPGIGNTDFTKGIIRSPDKYTALKSFLGNNASELAALQKTTRSLVLRDSLADGSSTALDGPTLVKQLEKLQSDNPQLFADAFGSNGRQFVKAAKVLSTFQHNLPAEEVEALLNPANRATPNALSQLQQAERALKDQFTNGALKDWLTGARTDVDLDQLIRFLPNYKLSDVQGIMSRLAADPEALEQWQRKTIMAIFQEARRNPSPADVLAMLKAGGKGGDVLSGSSLAKALGKGDQFDKYKAILSPEQMEFVQDMAKRELLREEKLRVGGGAGMLAKGDEATAFLDALTPGKAGKSLTAGLSGFARDKIASIVLASPKLSSLLLAPHSLAQMPTVIGAIISSEPFVRGVLQEFKDPGAAYKVLATLKTAYGVRGQQQQQQPGHTMSDEEFLKLAQPQPR